MSFQLAEPKLEYLAIRVKDLDKAVSFYSALPGFSILSEENNLAYFSSSPNQRAFLILEDTPFGKECGLKPKKLARFSLRVKDAASYLWLLDILQKGNQPVEKVVDTPKGKAFTVRDPEGNQITFFLDHKQNETPFLYTLGKIHLNVFDSKESFHFFKEDLGLETFMDNGKYFHLSPNSWLGMNEKDIFVEEEETEVLGLDFLTVSLPNQQELKRLSDHLNEVGIDYFQDQKLTIVTVFDKSQVEWWFVDRENRKGRH